MDEVLRDIHFRLMALGFMFRDLPNPPEKILKEADIGPGDRVLDFGCGPGSYSLAAAKLVGEKGEKIYTFKKILPLSESN